MTAQSIIIGVACVQNVRTLEQKESVPVRVVARVLGREEEMANCRHIRKLGLILVIGIALLLGTVADRSNAEPVKGGVVTMVQTAEPPVLVSAVNSSGFIGMISTKIHEGLLTYDFGLSPKPALAKSWEVSPDGKTLTFSLRKDVKWHDGEPFTSEDVRFSILDVWREVHPRGKVTFSKVTDVETPDEHTVVVRLSEPVPQLIAALNAYESPVLPAHVYKGHPINDNPALSNPIGTGPFKFVEWEKGSFVRLERNGDYWQEGKPHLDGIVLKIVPDAGARAAAFETDEAQFGGFNPVPVADLARLDSDPKIDIVTKGYEYFAPMYLMEVNLRHEALKNQKVRQALLHAVDREFVVDNIWFGYGKVATGPIASTSPYYTVDGVSQYPFDVERAKALLDEAGWPVKEDGKRFAISTVAPPMPEMVRTAEYLKQALTQISVEVEIKTLDLGSFIRSIYTDYDFGLTQNWLYLLPDPTLGVQRLYWSENISKGTPFANASGFSSQAADAALEMAQAESDPEARKSLFAEFQQVVQDELPILNLFEMTFTTVVTSNLKNHTTGADGPMGNFADTYLEQ